MLALEQGKRERALGLFLCLPVCLRNRGCFVSSSTLRCTIHRCSLHPLSPFHHGRLWANATILILFVTHGGTSSLFSHTKCFPGEPHEAEGANWRNVLAALFARSFGDC